MILEFLNKELLKVQKPARYIGYEFNSILKERDGKLRIALAFPDVYEVGMSHYGLELLYHYINSFDDYYAERVFLPWVDMIELMEKKGIPLFTLETKTPIFEMDVLGISISYELSFTNILKLLELSKINIDVDKRKDNEPIVIAGGPVVFNIEPLYRAFDVVYLGDGEENLKKILEILNFTKGEKRIKRLEELSKVGGIYIPLFYKQSGRKVVPVKNVPKRIKKNVLEDLDDSFVPVNQIIPNVQSIHDRAVLEISRGCTRGCRFCHAGYIYRPVRERTARKVVENAKKILNKTGYEEISLLSLSAMDHSTLNKIVDMLLPYVNEKKISLSIPSTRVDAFNVELLTKIASVRKRGITLAPEAGSQKMRDKINKNIALDEILRSALEAKKAGWNKIKLYFMVGFPGETEEDVREIGELLKEIKSFKFKLVTASINLLVPKPHTAFQFAEVREPEYMEYVYNVLKPYRKYAKIDVNDGKQSFIEAILSRGDRRLYDVVKKKYVKSYYDEWSEHFNFEDWIISFNEENVNLGDYKGPYTVKDNFPWDHIESGVTKYFLWKEYEKFLSGEKTDDCRNICSYCGVCQILKVENKLKI
ncbi:radical SAM protein [Thermosipho melanesiensis]|uniref:Radical SAM domain protein n=2 Tax=Thermosipho melanesiensis TaxID=46541 RepID=A6LJF5_THEM4|nr:TIGR03960 family B12-binding radical SAM protein [Thermosipho melanesiensis]ABR30056.1 Radical SAM domain protein [Thermosipho melanesiensis BI429]APT73253.1 radical SAM protein [Thermosipho melanesiensis]OOC38649.1 radical SAM protein [Thermosipho melanesiensis]OOC40453.1 radical SAM protein [Thermosipho melanesiensis]OOC40718.1 radical SAM protein [Thermosipho melanesiensis]